MASRLPDALLAPDIKRDAGMTNPGTSACFQGIGDLCQMFDNHIAQLGKLKETALRTEHELRSKITSMEQEKREYDEKIRRLELEILVLKGNGVVLEGGLTQPQRTAPDEGEDWKGKYEEMQKKCKKLEEELHSRSNVCSNFNTGLGSDLHSEQISTQEDLPVTVEHRLYLSEKVSGNNFKHVLRYLSVPDTDVDNIYFAHQDPKECCIQGLKKWMENKGKKATVWALIQGLLKSRLRNVAEDFCVIHNLHQLHQQIGQLDDPVPPPVSPLAPESEEEVQFDAADAPTSPAPACPSDASPLNAILWPHLRHPTCNSLEDLDLDLTECDNFTSDQLQKLTRRKFLQNESQREEFLKACRGGNAIPVLNELVRRLSATQSMDQSSIMMTLGKMLRKLNRKDIRKVLISYLNSGVIGPSMDEKMYIRDLVYTTQSKIGIELSKTQQTDLRDWRCLASDLGHSKSIHLFEKKDSPGTEVLKTWQTSNEATVGKLYEWAVKGKRSDIVKIMEEDMSNAGI